MLSYKECLDMCDLSEDEIEAIAEHEHLEPIVAMALGKYMVEHNASHQVRQYILDDIEQARAQGNSAKMALLTQTLCHFMTTHPDSSKDASRVA